MYIRVLVAILSNLSPVWSSPLASPHPYLNINPGTDNIHNMSPTSNINVDSKSGNPIFPGWYADPEARIFDTTYWIYPTTSTVYEAQTTLDAFSSPDLLTWTRHPHVLNITRIPWSTNRAAWAPSVVAAHDTYYMYFSAGDGAGIGVARSVSGRPDGPFEDAIGKPLVPETIHGAQPIDAQVFIDDDASVWLYFGGWSHAVVVPLSSDMISLAGDYKEITPKDYVEGPWVLKRNGVYYFMYSVGGLVSLFFFHCTSIFLDPRADKFSDGATPPMASATSPDHLPQALLALPRGRSSKATASSATAQATTASSPPTAVSRTTLCITGDRWATPSAIIA